MSRSFLSICTIERAFVTSAVITDNTGVTRIFGATQGAFVQRNIAAYAGEFNFAVDGTLTKIYFQLTVAVGMFFFFESVPAYCFTNIGGASALWDVCGFVATVAQFFGSTVVVFPQTLERGVLVIATQFTVRGIDGNKPFGLFGQVDVGIIWGNSGTRTVSATTSYEQDSYTCRDKGVFHGQIPFAGLDVVPCGQDAL